MPKVVTDKEKIERLKAENATLKKRRIGKRKRLSTVSAEN